MLQNRIWRSAGASTSGTASVSNELHHVLQTNPRRHCAKLMPAQRMLRARQKKVSALVPSDKPDWVRMLEEDAEHDEDVAGMLRATGGDPEQIQQRMRAEMDALHARITGQRGAGGDAPVEVTFRQVDPFDLWVWLELYSPPSPAEAEMLQEVVNSWFMLGRLSGFNSANLQVLYAAGDAEGLRYETPEPAALVSSMHDIAPLETEGCWARFWVDMGTADELALDVLINSLLALSREHVGIRRLVVGGDRGGQDDEWELPERELPQQVTMDPSSW